MKIAASYLDLLPVKRLATVFSHNEKVISLGILLTLATSTALAQSTFTGPIINATTGYQNNGVAPSGYSLAGNGTNFVSAAPGLQDSVNSPVTSSSYTIACDSTSGVVDRGTILRFQSGASAVTIPQSSATGCSGVVVTLIDESAGSVTFSRSGSDTINVYTGAAVSTGQTGFSLSNGQYATLNSNGSSGVWELRVSPGTNGILSPFGNGSSTVYATRVSGGNFSTSSSTATAISGSGYALAITFPANTALNVSFSCDFAFSVSSVSSSPLVNFYVQDVSTSPTSGSAMGTMGISTGSVMDFAFTGFTGTGSKAIFSGTPTAQADTAVHHAHLAGGVEQPSGSASVFQIMVSTSASTVTVYRNSFCTWQENAY